jgi:hypothetical protein
LIVNTKEDRVRQFAAGCRVLDNALEPRIGPSQMTLRNYIALFFGRIPVYSQDDNNAKYFGHVLFWFAIVAGASVIMHACQPMAGIGKALVAIATIGGLIGMIRSITCLKQAIGG